MRRVAAPALLLLALFLVTRDARAAVVYESATMGTAGQTSGTVLSSSQLLAVRFQTTQSWQIQNVGGHLYGIAGGNGLLFAAVVPVASLSALPATGDLSDAIWSTTFTPTTPSSDFAVPASFSLPAGYWALVIGSGRFGATGVGAMPTNNTNIGAPAFCWFNGTSWNAGGVDRLRFFLNGTTGPVDADDDGWTVAEGDCNDNNPNIHPGASELCNGVDDDCDNSTGDGEDEATFGDACDGADSDQCEDGVIVCSSATLVCNDDPQGAAELCDGQDNDCDPTTADGADEATLGDSCDGTDADLCEGGVVQCSGGTLGCSDDSASIPDLCDGQDNDCNPSTPDGSDEADFDQPCDGADQDLCEEGTWSCTAGSMLCSDATGSSADVCDGVDNDCNPATADGADEATFGQPCDGDDPDTCADGAMICDALLGMVCDDLPGELVDLCNGVDDDCDPSTPDGSDEPNLGLPCDGADSDACEEGEWICDGANGLVCDDDSSDSLETCNGVDDDCNGVVDDADDADGDGFTVCEGDCNDGDGAVHPNMAEDCTDGVDTNCDGVEDADDPACATLPAEGGAAPEEEGGCGCNVPGRPHDPRPLEGIAIALGLLARRLGRRRRGLCPSVRP